MSFIDQVKFHRIERLPQYAFEPVSQSMKQLRAQSIDIINMGMGNPDQPPPAEIIQKLCESASKNDTHRYSISKGIYRLRQAICSWYMRHYDVSLDPDSQTIVTMGSKEGLAHLAMSLFVPGDSILVPSPCYPVHHWGAVIAGADIRHIQLDNPEVFLAQVQEAAKNSYPKPKALILNFPSNPSAYCVEQPFFDEIVKIAKKHEIIVIHDLAYANISFDGYKPPSFLQSRDAIDVGVEFYSLSKSFNMPGWRVGFCSGNATIISALAKLKSYLDYGLFTPIQVASVIALDQGDQWASDISQMYRERRDVLVQGLRACGWEVDMPKATMFVWAKLPPKLQAMNSVQASLTLLNEAGVATTPGLGFGPYGEGFLRFSLIENKHRIRQALRGIKRITEPENI